MHRFRTVLEIMLEDRRKAANTCNKVVNVLVDLRNGTQMVVHQFYFFYDLGYFVLFNLEKETAAAVIINNPQEIMVTISLDDDTENKMGFQGIKESGNV